MKSGGLMNQGRVFGLISTLVAFASLATHAADFPAKPGEYVVRLKASTGMHVESLQQTLGVQVKRVISKDLNMVLVQKPLIETSASVVQSLQSNPAVEYA